MVISRHGNNAIYSFTMIAFNFFEKFKAIKLMGDIDLYYLNNQFQVALCKILINYYYIENQ